MTKRVEHLERINIEIKTKLEETTILYEASVRDNRAKTAEITRLNHEVDKLREQNNQLSRDNKKLSGKPALQTNHYACVLIAHHT